MGKASRNKRESARDKIAAQREAARRAERRRRMLMTGGSILGVIVIVVAFVLFKVLSSPPAAANASGNGATGTTLPATVVNDVVGVPASTLNTVGNGNAYPKTLQPITASPLKANGKPEVLYMGAEYCPYCAAERWAMAVALSKFGTFANLHGIHSSSTDIYPSTPTLTFYKSSYSSKYISFSSVEEYTPTDKILQIPTAAQQALIGKYDYPPYISSVNGGAIPFVDFGGKYLIHGAEYDPQVLHGLTWSQVAAALANPGSPVAKAIDGAANNIIAGICKLTNNQPASVCTQPAVKTLQGQL